MSPQIRCILRSLLFDSVGKYLEDTTSHADAIHWHLNNMNFEEFSVILMDFFEVMLKQLRKVVSWDKITIAFDETFIPYYGKNKSSCWVHGYVNGVKGAVGSYKFMVASVVLAKKRFNLFMVPMATSDNSVKLVDEILVKIKKYFRVELVLLDRGFASKEAAYNLEKANVKYIILCPKWTNVRKHLKNKERIIVEKTKFYYDKKRYDVDMKYVFAYGFYEHNWAFITNTNYKTPLALILYYKGRWSIETGFRVMDLADIKSKSTNMIVRAFLFTISLILHNEWLEFRETENITFAKYLQQLNLANINLTDLFEQIKLAKQKFNVTLTTEEQKILSSKAIFNFQKYERHIFIQEKSNFKMNIGCLIMETNLQNQIIV